MFNPANAPNAAEQIHRASLDLLENPGIKIEHDEIAALLLKNGAKPGDGPDVIRLLGKMVEELIRRCPHSVSLTDRIGNPTVLSATAETAPAFWSCPGLNLYRHGRHHRFTSADMADIARLLHHLPHVQAVFGMALADAPPTVADVIALNIIARNTTKHIRVLCASPEGARTLVEIKPIVGNHPWFSIGFTAHGPLRWTHLALEIFRATAGHAIPASINGEPMAGVSGPVTLAGAAAVGNAEILAGLVINQLLEPGRPCIYNLGLAHVFDMKTAMAVTGRPENALLAGISAQMGRFYNLPSASWVSTESMCPDEQAALEKMFGIHTHMAAGVSNIWGVGQLESELTISTAQAVIDNEMIAYAKRFRRGVAVTPETLAIDITREVGPAGSFLDHEHTAENFRTELFAPNSSSAIAAVTGTGSASPASTSEPTKLPTPLSPVNSPPLSRMTNPTRCKPSPTASLPR